MGLRFRGEKMARRASDAAGEGLVTVKTIRD
jgi:hypothetical protein